LSMESLGLAVLFSLFALLVCLWASTLYAFLRKRSGFWTTKKVRIVSLLTFGLFIFALIDSFFIEPYWLSVTETELQTEAVEEPLLILHISDIHYEGQKEFLEEVLSVVEERRPDVVCITGDYLNRQEDEDIEDVRDFIRRLSACCTAVLAVSGNWDNTLVMERLFGGLPANVYYEKFVYRKGKVAFVMLPFGFERFVTDFAKKAEEADYRILLFHTPELAENSFVTDFFDLYLCGHTHGGQVRLPLWGALITLSRTGKKFEQGLYRIGGMHLYVNRGLGMTPVAPRMRFLCRPEVTLIRISPRS